MALYGAAARQSVPEGQVLIRYLDSGETRAVLVLIHAGKSEFDR
jgi:hypothetical protein